MRMKEEIVYNLFFGQAGGKISRKERETHGKTQRMEKLHKN